MTDYYKILWLTAGISTAISALVGFLVRTWVRHQYNKDLERFKLEQAKALQAHQIKYSDQYKIQALVIREIQEHIYELDDIVRNAIEGAQGNGHLYGYGGSSFAHSVSSLWQKHKSDFPVGLDELLEDLVRSMHFVSGEVDYIQHNFLRSGLTADFKTRVHKVAEYYSKTFTAQRRLIESKFREVVQ